MEKTVQIDIAAAMASIIQQYAESQVNLEDRLRAKERECTSLKTENENLLNLVKKLERKTKAATKQPTAQAEKEPTND
ncbi:hypothetical protein [Microviridae sp.]|nr:hypothetical protein [Microviridae sp.]